MEKFDFCRRFVFLSGAPISFDDRPYLPAIYAADCGNLVLRCSRQTEKSTFLVNTILYEACTRPGIQILFVCPRLEQAQVFSRARLMDSLMQSPLIRRRLLGRRARRTQVMSVDFVNGSRLYVRAAYHSGDSCRGISAQLLLIDEFQDIADGDLPVLQETLSHAESARTILTGTPKSVDNHLEAVFRQSTANEWAIICTGCEREVILDDRSLGPTGLICFHCAGTIDPRLGRWVPRNPDATWKGYWICHPMVPWLDYEDILDRQRNYDIAKFKNEVLGLSTTLGDHIVTRGELEECCREKAMACTLDDVPRAARGRLVAGIDWGGGGQSRTVLVIGFMRSDNCFQVLRFERFAASEEPNRILEQVSRRCREFEIRFLAADGLGNGTVYNRLLVDRLQLSGMYAIQYSTADHEPHANGAIMRWTVNRSNALGVVFTRVKKQKLLFPCVSDCGSFLDEIACEVAEYDPDLRTVKYTHPETQPDDALHATNYALLLATRIHQSAEALGADAA